MRLKLNLQLFAGEVVGVFPVNKNKFYIGIKGKASTEEDMVIVKDLETFAPSIDSNVEEWYPMDQEGWVRRAVTAKGISFTFSGKRHFGDPGNDYVAAQMLTNGQECETKFKWEIPNGDVLEMNCILNVTSPSGGDSTQIDTLEFELLSDGKPTYTPAAEA